MAPAAVSSTPPASEPAKATATLEENSIFRKKGGDVANFSVGGTAAGGGSTVPRIPDFATKEEERLYVKQRLAGAFRVFAANGFDEGLSGHMSMRDPIDPHTFWINPSEKIPSEVGENSYSMHFADIKVSDLVRVTEEAEVVHGHHAVNAAGFAIHSEIHQAHPWINAVCHAHSTAGKAWSVFGEPLPPLTQDSLKFHGGHTAVLHEYHGPVVTTAEGQAIAGVIGDDTNVVVLRNHGILSVGATIDEACYWFLSFDRSCQAQLMVDAAVAGGRGGGKPPREIDEETAMQAAKMLGARQRGWLHFQPYYTNMLEKTNGAFLQ